NTVFSTPNSLHAQDDFKALIRAVQEKSRLSYEAIQAVSFKGHSKTYIYFGFSPLEVNIVPYMNEYYFDGLWIKPDSLRMIVRALRDVRPDSTRMRVNDDLPLPNPFHFIYDPSALGIHADSENKEKMVLWPLYPFAPGADSIYDYRLDHEIGFGENRIFAVQVTPKDKDIPAVAGNFFIDAYRHEVVGSDIALNEAASLFEQAAKQEGRLFRTFVTGSNNHRVKTQKELLYGSYWLPTSMEEEFDIGMWGMNFKIHRYIKFESYTVNPDIPDTSLWTHQKIVYARDPKLEQEVFDELPYPNRLSREEEQRIIGQIRNRLIGSEIYSEFIGSEDMAREASMALLNQRFARHLRFVQSLGDYFLYNRVEGLRLHYGFVTSNWPVNYTSVSIHAGYGLHDKEWKAEAATLWHINREKRWFLEGSLYSTIGYEENRRLISTANNTFTSLVYKGDYRDYYYKEGGNIGVGCRLTDQLALKLTFISQNEKTALNNTRFSIFRNNRPFRDNPGILDGHFQGIQAKLLYRSNDLDADLQFEHTDPDILKSDFSYRFMRANLRKRWRITYHSDLHFYVSGAASWGALTPQRWFDFGGTTFLNYHGNLRGVDYKAFTGDRAAYTTLEYTIKGSAFYDLGLKWGWIKLFKMTLWGGTGWSSLTEKSRNLAADLNIPSTTAETGYRELGLGIGDALNIFRLDFVRTSLQQNTWLIRFNILR
ncbi:MAG: DUF5686 family protein, partial [bacterium]